MSSVELFPEFYLLSRQNCTARSKRINVMIDL